MVGVTGMQRRELPLQSPRQRRVSARMQKKRAEERGKKIAVSSLAALAVVAATLRAYLYRPEYMSSGRKVESSAPLSQPISGVEREGPSSILYAFQKLEDFGLDISRWLKDWVARQKHSQPVRYIATWPEYYRMRESGEIDRFLIRGEKVCVRSFFFFDNCRSISSNSSLEKIASFAADAFFGKFPKTSVLSVFGACVFTGVVSFNVLKNLAYSPLINTYRA